MHSPKVLFIVALVTALTIAPTGCSADPPHPKPTHHRHIAPVFKTDAEALAAAKKAYTRYLAVEDAFLQSGGIDIARFNSIVTKSWIRIERRSANELRAEERRQTGVSRFFGMQLKNVTEREGLAEVSTHMCLDLSDLAFVSIHNKQDVEIGTVLKLTMEVDFKSAKDDPERLLIERQEPWAGADLCR